MKALSNTSKPGTSRRARARRGVAAVLAMMFLILFGSLSVAMAVASRGNITTAATHLHVSRAQSAAETGLAIARARLQESAARFLMSDSQVDSNFGSRLWRGDFSGMGPYSVVPARSGRLDLAAPQGMAAAVAESHSLDLHADVSRGLSSPVIGNAPAWASSEYAQTHWVFTQVFALEPAAAGSTGGAPLGYSIVYAPLANGTDVRAIVTGYDFAYTRGGEPITRVIMQDFRMVKRVNHAVISPSRIMIGKNVLISGDLGARYTAVTHNNGDPLTIRSDFRGLDAGLDSALNAFFARLASSDVDGDNRLRAGHPIEGPGIPANQNYWGDSGIDNAFGDATGDGFLDEFDIFINRFDTNGDGRVTLSTALTDGTPAQGATPEFTLDDDLALLIDSSNPDRNRNGVSGFVDTNRNGRWDSGEAMNDRDAATNTNRDQVLGYRDGFIDRRDQYAKVAGRLSFRVTQQAWQNAQGAIAPKLRGPIVPRNGAAPTSFGVPDTELPDINVGIFNTARNGLQSAANGEPFWQQVATQLGVSTAQLATYTESRPEGSTQPRYLRLDPDNNNDSLPDNWQTAYFERMPFNSPNFSDWYYRPVFQNMVFRDVEIPMGLNALFRNCTFVGVTWVRAHTDNTHVLWGEYGKMAVPNGQTRPQPSPPRFVYGDDSVETNFPTMLPSSARPPNQMILMATTPLDKADLPSNQAAVTQGFNNLPDPLLINGRRVTDTRAFSNNLRFHDCLFVGSIVSDAPTNFTQTRNKMQFTGSTRFVQQHPDSPQSTTLNPEPNDRQAIATSSMMLPNYSVDIGTFNSPQSQNVELRGAIIAGVLDVRGNASIDGALLLTFSPTLGQGPLRDSMGNPIGNPAGFNTTIGYFGPDDGDSESLDPATLPLVGGVRVVGWDTNGDGLADVPSTQPQPAGSTAVPFNGYGRIHLRFDPRMSLPNGIMLPMQFDTLAGTYREGKP